MSEFTYTLTEKNKNVLISFDGNLVDDVEIHDEIKLKVDSSIDNKNFNCIIDLSKVEYMSSNGIGLLITLLTKFRNKGGEVELINVSEQVKKLLLITKLNLIFDIK